MESRVLAQKNALLLKKADIASALEAIVNVRAQIAESDRAVSTRFKLSETIYMKAELDSSEKVYLWLGANVMLEYTYEEAETLLSKNFEVNWILFLRS
jgi:prefoldin subunit 5